MYTSALKTTLLTILAFAGLSTTTVHAAGTSLHIEQKNGVGEWALTYPNGTEYSNVAKTKILSSVGSGAYRINVRPPANAYASISLYENNILKQESKINSMVFDLKENMTYRTTVRYTFGGTIEVHSEPSGVYFKMHGANGSTFTGKTPAIYTKMPTALYRVTYGLEPDCEAQKSQERSLAAGSNLNFVAKIHCGTSRIATPGKTAKPLSSKTTVPTVVTPPTSTTVGSAQRIMQTVSSTEVVAGSRVRVTLSIRNITRHTLHNVHVTDTFSPDMVSIVMPLTNNGVVNGNLIEWNVPTIFAGQTWTTSFEITIKDTVKTGDRILLLARASSDENNSKLYPEAWSSVVGIGVAYLPQTGKTLDVAFVLAAMFAAAIFSNVTVRRNAPVAFKTLKH